MRLLDELRDPWVGGGLTLLTGLSVLTVLLYRTSPTGVGEARARVLASALPGSFSPRLDQARQRLRSADASLEAGRDSAALFEFSESARHAGEAWELAGDEADAGAALDVWARATLGSAEVLLSMGTGAGLALDDNPTLGAALEQARQVSEAPVEPALRARAAELIERIERQLRPGPLEWLPPWRS